MYVFWFILLALTILAIMAGIFASIGIALLEDEFGLGALVFLVSLCLIPVAIMTGVAGTRNLQEHSCSNFSNQTGYEAKVIITNRFDGGTCFVLIDNNWLPKDQLRINLQEEQG